LIHTVREVKRLKTQLIVAYDLSPTAQRLGGTVARAAGLTGATALMFALAWLIVNVLT
jgi:hypothetical protein